MVRTKKCPNCNQMKPVGAFNFGENGNCNKCSKPKEYAEGYFKPFKTVEKIFIG